MSGALATRSGGRGQQPAPLVELQLWAGTDPQAWTLASGDRRLGDAKANALRRAPPATVYALNNVGPRATPQVKMISKWIRGLQVKTKATNLLRGKWEKIFVTKIRQRFLKYDTKKAQPIKQIDKQDIIKK